MREIKKLKVTRSEYSYSEGGIRRLSPEFKPEGYSFLEVEIGGVLLTIQECSNNGLEIRAGAGGEALVADKTSSNTVNIYPRPLGWPNPVGNPGVVKDGGDVRYIAEPVTQIKSFPDKRTARPSLVRSSHSGYFQCVCGGTVRYDVKGYGLLLDVECSNCRTLYTIKIDDD